MTSEKSLLALPAEIRSKIWRFCVESLDDSVTMCPCEARPSCKHTFSSLTAISQVSRRSCEGEYSERAIYTTNLNLIFVNKQLRSEAEHLYSTKVLKFCSRVCFADLLKTMGNRYDWIKKIEIVIDLRPLRVGFSYSSARYLEMLRDEKELLCNFTNRYFSSFSFEGREIWSGFDVTGATQHDSASLFNGQLENKALAYARNSPAGWSSFMFGVCTTRIYGLAGTFPERFRLETKSLEIFKLGNIVVLRLQLNDVRKRYSVTLNAPTTAVKALGDQLTSLVDQDAVYHISILDTAPIRDEAHQYHSVIRVCLDDEPQESSSRQLTASENPANINICTIEYAPFPSKIEGSPQTLPTLHSSLENSFSVTWSSSTVTGGSYCLIPIILRNFSGPGNVALKLLVGTERIQVINATLSRAEQYEESFARIRLFSGGDAQKTRAAEIADVERQIFALQHAVEQTKVTPEKVTPTHSSQNDAHARQSQLKKSATKKRKASTDIHPASANMKEHASLTNKLLFTKQRLSTVRPVQVFRAVVSAQGQESQFHMPSQQTKVSNSGAQGNRICKGSKNTKTLRPSTYKSVSPSSKIPAAAAETLRRRRPSPMVCFYVRPEHLPNADYIAIYLSDQDFPSLLSALSSKLHIPIGDIGTIYYYDQQMTPVVVNEISIKSLSHEQDLIVRLPWLAKQLPELPTEVQYQVVFPPEEFSDHASMFDQYLTIPLEASYATSVGSWSDFTDDASMSMSHMFAQSATLSPAGEVHYEGRHLHHSVLGEQGIDYASCGFGATLPTISLSSTPMQSTPQLAAPIPDMTQILPPQAEMVQISAVEERLISGTAHSVKEESVETRFLPSHSPPVSRTYTPERPTSLRNYRRPPSVEKPNVNGKIPKSGQIDQDAAYALERNRLAAMKCRLTRKEKETRLQDLSKQKLEMNEELKYEIRRLKAEISEAKGLLKMHVSCA